MIYEDKMYGTFLCAFVFKAEDEMNAAKVIFEDMNSELKKELPILFDT